MSSATIANKFSVFKSHIDYEDMTNSLLLVASIVQEDTKLSGLKQSRRYNNVDCFGRAKMAANFGLD